MPELDNTTVIRPPKPHRRRHAALWTVVGILVGAALLGGLAGAARAGQGNGRPATTPTPSVSYSGTWRIIRVPGAQTGISVPAPQYTTPPPRVITRTVPGPTVTVPGPVVTRTVPGPAVTVRCTVTVDASAPSGAPTPAPVCTTDAPTAP